MSVGFITPDPLNNLTNLYQRPIFIQADRTPTILDVYPAETTWGDNVQPNQNLYVTPGKGIWYLFAPGSGGSLNTINNVANVAGNINLIDQAGAGAIQITAPGSGGAGTVGIGVKVDGTSVVISGGDVLTAPLSLTSVQDLQGDDGINVAPVAGVIKVIGDTAPVQGAIRFQNSVAGQLDAIVQTDGTTITINAANELQVLNTVVQTIGPTAAGGAFDATGTTIAIPAGSAYYVEADIIGRNGATLTNVAGGKQQCVVQNLAGVITIHGTQNQYLAENPAAPSGQQDFQFVTAVGGIALQVFGAAAIPMTYKARINFVAIP